MCARTHEESSKKYCPLLSTDPALGLFAVTIYFSFKHFNYKDNKKQVKNQRICCIFEKNRCVLCFYRKFFVSLYQYYANLEIYG